MNNNYFYNYYMRSKKVYNPEYYKPNKYYIAYGSNMDINRLKKRCPNSEYIGIGVIEGYKLIFRESATGFYASIDKIDYRKRKKKKSKWLVPVVIFRISKNDEDKLDKFEGFPRWYKKVELEVKDSRGSLITGMGYVLPETSRIGVPDSDYYSIISNAYKDLGIDLSVLEKAFLFSYKKSDCSVTKNVVQPINQSQKVTEETRKIDLEIYSGIRNYLFNSDGFLNEFKRELELRLDLNVFIEFVNNELNIIDVESGETYFIVYPPSSGSTFYLENIIEGDFLDYSFMEEAVQDIVNYFSVKSNLF